MSGSWLREFKIVLLVTQYLLFIFGDKHSNLISLQPVGDTSSYPRLFPVISLIVVTDVLLTQNWVCALSFFGFGCKFDPSFHAVNTFSVGREGLGFDWNLKTESVAINPAYGR